MLHYKRKTALIVHNFTISCGRFKKLRQAHFPAIFPLVPRHFYCIEAPVSEPDSTRLESGNSPRSSALEVPYRTYYLSNRRYISWPSRRPAAARGQCQCRGTTERRRATLRLRSSGGGPSSPSPPRPPRRRRRGRHRRPRTSWRDSSTCPPSGPRGRRRRATASCGRASPGPSRASSRPLPAPARIATRTRTRTGIAASGDASGPASSTTADAPRFRRRSTPRRVSYELQSLALGSTGKALGPLRVVFCWRAPVCCFGFDTCMSILYLEWHRRIAPPVAASTYFKTQLNFVDLTYVQSGCNAQFNAMQYIIPIPSDPLVLFRLFIYLSCISVSSVT